MRILKLLFSNLTSHKLPTNLPLCHISTRSKSSSKSKPHKKSKNPRQKQPPPSLFQTISQVVGSEDTPFSFSKQAAINNPPPQSGTPAVCQNAPKTSTMDEDVSPIVHNVTSILRSQNLATSIEQRLEDAGITFTRDIVEKVLKRCFKVGPLALRFFNWAKLRPEFSHTTETYNVMLYIAGEAGDFDLVEKLGLEMDELGLKNAKTWTILISHYGKAKKIGKALSTFEEMRRSGCELDRGAYEAVVRVLVGGGKGELAVEFYKEMLAKNMEVVDSNLCESIMCCLCRLGDVVGARSIANDMVNVMKIPETEVYSRTLRSLCVCGNTDEARALLDEMKRKNVPVGLNDCKILLKGLCRAGRMMEAMVIVDEMKQNASVDSDMFVYLIDGFLRDDDISKALEVLHEMKKLGWMPMVSSYTQIIQQLFKSGNYRKACELYEEMIGAGVEPDSVAITAMVAGHVQHGHISEAWNSFERMKKDGKIPSWKAYSVFIKELCKASKPHEALKLLEEMPASRLIATDDLYGLVISTLIRIGEQEKANAIKEKRKSLKLSKNLQAKQVDEQSIQVNHEVSDCLSSEEVKPTRSPKEYSDSDLNELCVILTCSTDWRSIEEALEGSTVQFTAELVTAVLCSCQRYGRVALEFFSWVGRKSGYRHTAETYNLAIKISGSGKDFKQMRKLFQEMKRRGCLITPNTWTIMIAQYGQAGLTEIALQTFKEMKFKGYQPNASAFKYLLVFLCGKKGRKIDEAIKIFQEMMHEEFMPDREIVDIYLCCLCESGKLAEARSCIKTLLKRGFSKQLGYSLLVKSLCRAGEVEEALKVTEEMKQNGCTADQFIYGSIVHALLRGGRLTEALDRVEEMRRAGIKESVHIQTSFIVHFCREKRIDKATEILEKMKDDGFEPTLVTYSAMIRGYINMGMFSDAWDVFHRLKAHGPLPDFVTYSMFISCLCRAGKSEDGLKLMHEMIERGIVPSAVNFRAVFHGLNREGKQELASNVLQTKWKLKRQRMVSV